MNQGSAPLGDEVEDATTDAEPGTSDWLAIWLAILTVAAAAMILRQEIWGALAWWWDWSELWPLFLLGLAAVVSIGGPVILVTLGCIFAFVFAFIGHCGRAFRKGWVKGAQGG